jgi:UDP-N-acetylglucosamine---dolichyl-phosphate N-acetylglucosaminyltransferase
MTPPGDAAPRRLPRLGIVIPARNEAQRIAAVLSSMPTQIDGIGERVVIVVDDGSTDQTSEVVRAHRARAIRHLVNLGKGAALTTGCLAALDMGCELIAVMDGDGQHEAHDLPRFLDPIRLRQADLSIGVRRLTGQMPPAMRLGNWGLSTAFRLLVGIRISDTQCGMRAFSAAAYPIIQWRASDYSVETEMLIRAARGHLRIAQVQIDVVYHDRYKGTTIGDGFKIFGDMLRLAIAR